jgi:hypothetical protein
MKKIDRIPLPTPDFGPKASPGELVVQSFSASAHVSWSCGIQSTHPRYFVYVQFLDPASAWSDRLIRRLHNDHFSWERGRPFLNVARQELNRVSLDTTEFIRSTINEVFAEARRRYEEFSNKYPDEPEPDPEPEPKPDLPSALSKLKRITHPVIRKRSTQAQSESPATVRRYTEAGSD